MPRKYNWILILLFLFTALSANSQKKYSFRQPKMGAPFTITIYGQDSAKIARVAKMAFRKVDSLNAIFSDYIDSSELNKLSRTSGTGAFIPVSSELFRLLTIAKKAAVLSHGAFDVTIGPVVELWRDARKEQQFPNKKQLRKALHRVGYTAIQFKKSGQKIRLKKPDMQLDLGGIAKGYIAQSTFELIKGKGFPSVMINAGGDIVTGDAPPGREGWKIGISLPESRNHYLQRIILLKNKAVATSGDIYQYLEWNGKRYSHIINPKTGMGVTTLRNVTVIANNGTTADWLASACSLLPLKKAFKLVQKFPGAALFIAEKRGDQIYKKGGHRFMKFFENESDYSF